MMEMIIIAVLAITNAFLIRQLFMDGNYIADLEDQVSELESRKRNW